MTASHAPDMIKALGDRPAAVQAPAGVWIIHGVTRARALRPKDAPPHSRIEVEDMLALVSPCLLDATPDAEREAAEALRHNAILAAYARETDVAPARFGALAAGPAAAAALIAAEAARHAAILDRVAGCVEMGARIVAAPPAPAAPLRPALSARRESGAAYLRGVAAARDERRRAAARQAEAVAALIEGLAVRTRESVAFPPKPSADGAPRLAEIALLVSRYEVAALRSRAAGLADQAAAAGLAIEITGPWPPYSFAAPKPEAEPETDAEAGAPAPGAEA